MSEQSLKKEPASRSLRTQVLVSKEPSMLALFEKKMNRQKSNKTPNVFIIYRPAQKVYSRRFYIYIDRPKKEADNLISILASLKNIADGLISIKNLYKPVQKVYQRFNILGRPKRKQTV